MNEIIYLLTGSIILILVMYDFFFTTLSGSGSAFITRFVSLLSHKILQGGVKLWGRGAYSLSGMIVNLMVLGVWVALVWLGLFLVFSFNPEAITNSDGRAATTVERLYFTGYVLSTLGIGNFKPITAFFELLTSFFSFFGFVFFTTSMTYLISVSSAVIHKRTLALSIHNLGKSPVEMVKNLNGKDSSYCFQKFSTLQEMIDRHYVNHQAYPVLHYYGNTETTGSISINLAILDEAITIFLYTPGESKYHNELLPLRNALTHYLKNMKGKISSTGEQGSDINFSSYNKINENLFQEEVSVDQRRKVLGDLLKSEGFEWEDVFNSSKNQQHRQSNDI